MVELRRGSARAKIHQATGIVVAQLGVDPDDALAVLRSHAFAGDTTLADIAQQLLVRQLSFLPDAE